MFIKIETLICALNFYDLLRESMCLLRHYLKCVNRLLATFLGVIFMSTINVANLTFGYEGSYDNVFENVSFSK